MGWHRLDQTRVAQTLRDQTPAKVCPTWPVRGMLAVVVLGLLVSACGAGERVITPDLPEPPATETDAEESQASEEGLPTPGPGEVLHPLTGEPVRASLLDRRIFALPIDNSPRARPQAGLLEADLVYEVPAEGGVTRFLAFFLSGEADRIGPVRSTRHYMLDLALEWQSVWGSAGGSPQYKAQSRELGIPIADDVLGSGGKAFYRDSSRPRPHNLYTDSQRMRDLMKERGWERKPTRHRPWEFVPLKEISGRTATEVRADWPGNQTKAVFRYDADQGRYLRFAGDRPMFDETSGEQLGPTNLIIQSVASRPIPGDTEGRLDVDLVGQGDIMVFSGGTVREGTWRKVDRPSPTVFSGPDGEPLTLIPGTTWILIFPERGNVTFH